MNKLHLANSVRYAIVTRIKEMNGSGINKIVISILVIV